MEACKRQTLVGPEALSQARPIIREGGGGGLISADIRGAAYVGCQALVLGRVVVASALEELVDRTFLETAGPIDDDQTSHWAQEVCRAGQGVPTEGDI